MKHKLIASSILLAFLAWRNGAVVNSVFRRPDLPTAYYAHGDNCELVREPTDQLKFCEDAVFWDNRDTSGELRDRRLIISCDPNRKNWNTVMGPLRDPNPRGALWVLNYGANGPEGTPRKIFFEGYPARHDFHPLGLDISHSVAGNASNLFVVNHARARTTIEQFTMSPTDPARARWVRTISSRYLLSANSIALTSPTSFYVTNDHLLTRMLPSLLGKTLPLIETLLGLPLAYINHVSLHHAPTGDAVFRYTFPALGIPFANGVALSPDGATLAVASTSLARVHIYARNVSNNALTLTSYVPMPFAPDNLAFDDTGALLVAGHPFYPAVVSVAATPDPRTAPSWVVSLRPRSEAEPIVQTFDLAAPVPASKRARAVSSHTLETLYQSDGTGFSTSSTGLVDARSGTLFVTGLYAEGILACRS